MLLKNGHSEAARLAAFLKLPGAKSMSDLALIERVERGFPLNTADTIINRIDPTGEFLQVYHIIPKTTYHRRLRNAQVLTKDESEKILALAKVVVEVVRQYHGDSKLTTQFLMREHPLLGGRTPIDVAKDSTAGADLVLKLLAQAKAGVAA